MTRRWWALAAVSLATFVSGLDNSVVNLALPTIQGELGLATSGLEWVVSGYVLVFAGLMLVGGRLALLVPLNSAVLGMLPPARAGAASAVLNASREVFGLFGVTVLGAILAARQTALVHQGDQPPGVRGRLSARPDYRGDRYRRRHPAQPACPAPPRCQPGTDKSRHRTGPGRRSQRPDTRTSSARTGRLRPDKCSHVLTSTSEGRSIWARGMT